MSPGEEGIRQPIEAPIERAPANHGLTSFHARLMRSDWFGMFQACHVDHINDYCSSIKKKQWNPSAHSLFNLLLHVIVLISPPQFKEWNLGVDESHLFLGTRDEQADLRHKNRYVLTKLPSHRLDGSPSHRVCASSATGSILRRSWSILNTGKGKNTGFRRK